MLLAANGSDKLQASRQHHAEARDGDGVFRTAQRREQRRRLSSWAWALRGYSSFSQALATSRPAAAGTFPARNIAFQARLFFS